MANSSLKSQKNYDYVFKILLLGPFAVGKTCMVIRYISNRFSADHQATIGTNIYVKNILLDVEGEENKEVCLQIWDLGGHIQRIQHMSRVFYKGASGAFLVYDVTRSSTFEEIPLWRDQMMEFSPDAYTMVVGNKQDLEDKREVTVEQGQVYSADIKSLEFMETSAKTGYQIEDAFQTFAKLLVKNPPPIKW